MRTNIELDDKLIKEAFRYSSVTTKRELVEIALREFVENHKRLNVLDLVGKVNIRSDYNYKKLRREKDG